MTTYRSRLRSPADATGAEISGDPEALASALIRLQQAAEIIPAAEGATPGPRGARGL